MLYQQEGVLVKQPILDAIRTHAENTGTPIRILFGHFRAQAIPAWTRQEAEACGTTLADAKARGVTLTVWGAASAVTGLDKPNIPAPFYTDGNARDAEIRETIAVNADSASMAIPYFLSDAPDFVIGEIEDRAVWFFFHLGYVPDADKLDMERVILEPIRASLSSDRIEEFRAEAAERSALLFVEAMRDMPKKRLSEKVGRVDALFAEITNLESQLGTRRSAASIMQREIDFMLSGDTVSEDHWKKQWHILHAHPLIKPNTLQMNGLTVSYETTELMIEDVDPNHLGKKYPIGNFRVSVDLENFAFKVRNLTMRIDNKDHPHIRDEAPCLGDYHAEVNDLFTTRELAALVEWLFGYLQSYNPADDYGRAIRLWRDKAQMDGTVVEI